jgi:polysaccharide pyruvyl transferase WcaK-like protein
MRVATLNLRYSPNLGDVMLSECLEYGLRQACTGLEIVSLDITGRRDFARGSTRRLAALAVMQKLPQAARHGIARVMLGRSLRRTLPFWTRELATADAAILGGGNLFADADLNFPLKVAAVMGAVAAAGLPAAVYGVGVSDNWSRDGEALFRKALAGVDLRDATVRDALSREIWIRRLGPAHIAPPRLARDSGLLAAECYPALKRPDGPAMRVGICVTHPLALRYHADELMPSPNELTAWFAEMAGAFTKRGCAAFLFTTGSPEDEAYLDAVMPAMRAAVDPAGSLSRVPRFAGASDMAGFISTLECLIAHRLHACVAAYSYGVPHIGLTWDRKMQSFFGSVDRGRFLRPAVSTPLSEILQIADAALAIGISADHQAAVMADTRNDIVMLLRGLSGAPV